MRTYSDSTCSTVTKHWSYNMNECYQSNQWAGTYFKYTMREDGNAYTQSQQYIVRTWYSNSGCTTANGTVDYNTQADCTADNNHWTKAWLADTFASVSNMATYYDYATSSCTTKDSELTGMLQDTCYPNDGNYVKNTCTGTTLTYNEYGSSDSTCTGTASTTIALTLDSCGAAGGTSYAKAQACDATISASAYSSSTNYLVQRSYGGSTTCATASTASVWEFGTCYSKSSSTWRKFYATRAGTGFVEAVFSDSSCSTLTQVTTSAESSSCFVDSGTYYKTYLQATLDAGVSGAVMTQHYSSSCAAQDSKQDIYNLDTCILDSGSTYVKYACANDVLTRTEHSDNACTSTASDTKTITTSCTTIGTDYYKLSSCSSSDARTLGVGIATLVLVALVSLVQFM